MWVATQDLPRSAAHPFYRRLNQILQRAAFDAYVERLCQRFYADEVGRPGLAPGRYFRMLLLGYFEGLDSERAIAWRAADSLSVRSFLGLELHEAPPDHSTVSRTRRLIDIETHQAVFTWVLQRLAAANLVKGKTIGIDATTLEANAALRSIVRRDTGEGYEEFLTRLAQASGIVTPTREDLPGPPRPRTWLGRAGRGAGRRRRARRRLPRSADRWRRRGRLSPAPDRCPPTESKGSPALPRRRGGRDPAPRPW